MKLTGLILVLVCCGSIGAVDILRDDFNTFLEYCLNFTKIYSDPKIKLQKFLQFQKGVGKINEMNRNSDDKDEPAGKDKAVYGFNKYTDWTYEEFRKLANLNGAAIAEVFAEMEEVELPRGLRAPAAFDWRAKNKVTPVKDQGSCGSCWTFCTAANIESAYAIKYNKLENFSEQQLLDCDRRSYGCDGGYPETAIQSIIDYKGLNFASKYPYENRQGKCRFQSSAVGARVSKNQKLQANNEEGMANYLSSTNTIINYINADGLQYYRSGIMDQSQSQCDKSRNAMNHALITVAYGKASGNSGMPFWVLKNSWGTNWGEKGFARVRRGVNFCGMANNVCSAVLA